MRLPRIGVTCRTATLTEEAGHDAIVDAALVELGEALSGCGTVPVLIPLGLPPSMAAEYLKSLDGIVLTGGPDIGAVTRDGAEPLRGGLDSRKDLLEWHLCSLALNCGIPVLGICRGLQVINVYLGGAPRQDAIADRSPQALPRARRMREDAAGRTSREIEIRVASTSKLATAFGSSTGRVRGCHHQTIKRLAPALRATAWARDGVIEGVESVIYRSLLAVQFHPEIDYHHNQASLAIFRWLAEEARSFLSLKEGQNLGVY